jgi:predicted MFS family arabinose efflux permease
MVYTVGSMAQILTGFALDRYPLRPTYMLIYLLEAPMLLLAANLSGLPLLLTALAMVFLAMGAIPVTDLLVARYTPANLRATVYGAKFVLSLGVASLGVPMVGIIRDYTGGFTVLFFVLSSLAAVVVAATFFLPREVSSLGKGGMVQPAMAGGTSGGTGD